MDNSELGKRIGALETNQVLLQKQTQETGAVVDGLRGPLVEMREVVGQITAHLEGDEQARFTGAARQVSLLDS